MELYLIRHGETESNREKRYRGWSESALSQKGVRQSEMAGFFLAGQNIEALYCSDLKRAAATARVIGASCGLEPAVTPLLREINFGQWEGLTYDQIEAEWGEQISLWLDDPFNRSAPGGETLDQVFERMQSFLDHLSVEYRPGQRIAAVTHGGAIRAVLYRVLDQGLNSFWDIKIDNASISLLSRTGDRFEVVYYNRVHHLGTENEKGEPADDL